MEVLVCTEKFRVTLHLFAVTKTNNKQTEL